MIIVNIINAFRTISNINCKIKEIEGEYENWDKPFFLYLELRKIDIE